jgi:hypothetical protein
MLFLAGTWGIFILAILRKLTMGHAGCEFVALDKIIRNCLEPFSFLEIKSLK